VSRLQDKYNNEVVPALIKKFNYKSIMEVPRLVKVVVNMGINDARENPKAIEAATGDMATITGQKPVVTKARKSIAAFKLREGMPVGAKVTLRAKKMYEFLDKLFNINLPRVRDFRGVSPDAFDGRGNYTLGIKEQLIFPEIDYDKIDRVRGMDITIVTTANVRAASPLYPSNTAPTSILIISPFLRVLNPGIP
jgi:large subunit ribosomal protein L5